MEEVRHHAVVPRLAAALRAFTVHVARRCGLFGGRDHESNLPQGLHRCTNACSSHFTLERNIVSQAPSSAHKRPRPETADLDNLGDAIQMELDNGNGKTAQEAHADDDDDTEQADFMAELNAAMDSANLAARAQDRNEAATEDSIGKLFKSLIAVGAKPGALSRDTLPAVVLKASQGEHCTIEYLDKPDPSLKGAAMIIVSELGYNNCLNAREVDGVRFLSEARANVDPAFAGRLDGVMVLRVSKGPKNLNASSKKQLEFYGNDIGEKIKACSPVVAHRLVKDGFVKPNDMKIYDALKFELLNADTMCTVGRKWGTRNVKNMFVFVFKWTYQDKPIKLQFLAPILSVVNELEVKVSLAGQPPHHTYSIAPYTFLCADTYGRQRRLGAHNLLSNGSRVAARTGSQERRLPDCIRRLLSWPRSLLLPAKLHQMVQDHQGPPTEHRTDDGSGRGKETETSQRICQGHGGLIVGRSLLNPNPAPSPRVGQFSSEPTTDCRSHALNQTTNPKLIPPPLSHTPDRPILQ